MNVIIASDNIENIGYETENGRTQVRFDLTEMMTEFPDGFATLAIRRPTETRTCLPSTVAMDGMVLVWTVGAYEIEKRGILQAQIIYVVDETVVKTKIYKFQVSESLRGDAPCGWEDWVDELAKAAAGVNEAIRDAEDTLNQAVDDAEDARDAAIAAQDAAETAMLHYPRIIDNYWYVWDVQNREYVDTGIKALAVDGVSPVVVIDTIQGGHRITITDATGPHSFDVVMDYMDLANKPSINGYPLIGNKTASSLRLVSDVQVDSNSVVANGVANFPFAADFQTGVVRGNPAFGISFISGYPMVNGAVTAEIKSGNNANKPITTTRQHEATFYGLAKAAGDVTQTASSNAVGTYTQQAKTAIQSMLGVPGLDASGKVPSSQLPSYVDDVVEYAAREAFPTPGESGKIYIALNTNLAYRWSGSTYVMISSPLSLGETSNTAYRGDRGKIAYDHASAKGSQFLNGFYKITTNTEGHVTGVSAVAKSDITRLGIQEQINASGILKGLGSGTVASVVRSDITDLGIQEKIIAAGVLKGNGLGGVFPATKADITNLGIQGSITATGILKGNGSGSVTAAVPGTDYINGEIIAVQDETPTDPNTQIWLPETLAPGIQVPTYSEFTTGLSGKLDAPVTPGTSGQVLTSDGQGGQSWQTSSGDSTSEMLAPDYSELTFPVSAGQHCIYDGIYYEANQVISSSENWTPAHWTQRTVGGEVGTLKNEITSKQDAPSTAGTEGQVLALALINNQLVPVWITPAGGSVSDVQVDGTSILVNGVANLPIASNTKLGVVMAGGNYGVVTNSDGRLTLNKPNVNTAQAGTNQFIAIMPFVQHASAFFGLAKAAGADMANVSGATVGVYPETQKSAISNMLSAPETISGTTPTITALPGIRYICGEVATLDVTAPESGCIDVVFTSGSTPTVLTVTSAKANTTIKWANDFDPTSLEANTVYEINIMDGEYGVACTWT